MIFFLRSETTVLKLEKSSPLTPRIIVIRYAFQRHNVRTFYVLLLWYQLLKDDDVEEAPVDGAYVHGLYVDGARWSRQQ